VPSNTIALLADNTERQISTKLPEVTICLRGLY
jgi:hypothetical protein